MKLETELERIIAIKGGNWAFFANNAKIIAEFIKNNNIAPSVIGQGM